MNVSIDKQKIVSIVAVFIIVKVPLDVEVVVVFNRKKVATLFKEHI